MASGIATQAAGEGEGLSRPSRSGAPALHRSEPPSGTSQVMQHTRSRFQDKQVIRLQEAPEHMPEGETPQTVSMCVWSKMVDVCKPGDRVEITGVYRASPIRSNPRHRTVHSLYKTWVDIVHVKKIDKNRRLQSEAEVSVASAAGEAREEYHEENELDAATDARVDAIKILAARPNIYEELSQSLAPSIWELEDLKKGILLQLFGGTHKQAAAHRTRRTRAAAPGP